MNPEEGEIGLGRSLDDRWVRWPSHPEGAKEECTGHKSEHDSGREHCILPGGIGNKGNPGPGVQVLVFTQVRCFADQTALHGPFTLTMPKLHPVVEANPCKKQVRNHKDVQRKESR